MGRGCDFSAPPQSFGTPIVIRRPGNCTPLPPPPVTPLLCDLGTWHGVYVDIIQTMPPWQTLDRGLTIFLKRLGINQTLSQISKG